MGISSLRAEGAARSDEPLTPCLLVHGALLWSHGPGEPSAHHLQRCLLLPPQSHNHVSDETRLSQSKAPQQPL